MHVVDSLAIGGAERMLVDIANQSVMDGYRVSVCVTRTGMNLGHDLRPEVRVHVLGRRRRFDLSAMYRFAKILRMQQVDVLHVQGRSSLALLVFMTSLKLISTPIVFHDQYNSISRYDPVPLWFRVASRHIGHYVGIFDEFKPWAVRAGIPANRISIISNAFPIDRFRDARPLDIPQTFGPQIQGKLVGVVVAGIRPVKGIDVLIEALAYCTSRSRVLVIVLGGVRHEEYATTCRNLVAERDLDATVLFGGERVDVPNVIKGADFAILPSRSESGPIALIEYMAAGLPFVASLVGDIGHRVASMGVPEFVEPGNAIALAKALDRLVDLPGDERRRRGIRGQQIAFREFGIRNCMPQWYEIYEAVGRGRR
jgi:glycosyltransferase involved in cell wall biosynthesis